MAKKNDAEKHDAEVIVEEKVDPVYALGEWNGMAQWRCLLCPFDTLNGGAALQEHLVQVHQIERVVEV